MGSMTSRSVRQARPPSGRLGQGTVRIVSGDRTDGLDLNEAYFYLPAVQRKLGGANPRPRDLVFGRRDRLVSPRPRRVRPAKY